MSHFDAEIDMPGTQFCGGIIVDMPVQVEKPGHKWEDRTVREDQPLSFWRFHAVGVIDQGDPQVSIIRNPASIMVAAQKTQPAIEPWRQGFHVFLPAKRQVAKVENYIARLDMKVPVRNDQLLPPIRPIAIAANVGVEEVCIRDQPGLGIKREFCY